jgi:hypothetical protein
MATFPSRKLDSWEKARSSWTGSYVEAAGVLDSVMNSNISVPFANKTLDAQHLG